MAPCDHGLSRSWKVEVCEKKKSRQKKMVVVKNEKLLVKEKNAVVK